MDPAEIDALVQRLVADPHDEEALAYAHEQGAQDPKSYAFLLEKVGTETHDASYASHWLSEAANVWSTTLGDAHRAARVLMMAIDKDPMQSVAAERLAQLYRDKGDLRGLVALLERRTKALAPFLPQNPELRGDVAGMHEELGRLWSEPPLSQPRKALESYRRAIELDPESAYAIYQARELLKAERKYDEAFPLYAAELSIERDPARRLALLRDEATTRRIAGDLAGSARALDAARRLDDQDPEIAQEYAATILERLQGGQAVAHEERALATELLVGLAEQYDGEHGHAYAGGALDLDPGHDRALQLFVFYGQQLGRESEATGRYAAYLAANPNGELAEEARTGAGSIPPPPFRAPVAPEDATNGRVSRAQATFEIGDAGDTAPSTGALAVGLAPGNDADVSHARPNQAPLERLPGLLDMAQALAAKGRKADAFGKYKEVLETDPAHPEALAWVEEYLRGRRDYAMLRDVLLASVRFQASSKETMETRKDRLREVAGLCEGNLRDVDGAVSAYKQLLAIDRTDDSARTALTRLLDKHQRWDDLANLYEQEATVQSDIDTKIALEKKLALLHEQKRSDLGAAAEAWARIARLTPEDDRPTATASKLFERAGQLAPAAQIIADNVATVDEPAARGELLERLGELRERLEDVAGAGEAYAEAAGILTSSASWGAAERCFARAERWDRAARAAAEQGQLASDAKTQAAHYARAAGHLMACGDEDGAQARLEQATELDPVTDEYASSLELRYRAKGDLSSLAMFFAKRGAKLDEPAKRVSVRRQAARLYASELNDKEREHEQWLAVLEDGEDREALERLLEHATEREDHDEAVALLRRLEASAVEPADKTRIALRQAELLADGLGDVDAAIARYEQIVAELDPACRPALQAIADLQEAREQPLAAANALERELRLVADPVEAGQIAGRLARLYDGLGDAPNAIRALDIVRKADPEDFDALGRLCDLCEATAQWDRTAQLLAERIEVEGDEEEASVMTRKLSSILCERLDRGDEALAVLTDFADHGDAACRATYAELGDRLGWKGIVAQKLVEWWFEARQSPERTSALRGAFERFEGMGRDEEALRVAIEVVRSKGADRDLAGRLEMLALKTNDHDALATAHDLLSRDVSGAERALELVRQAEIRARVGMPVGESIQHGEMGLTSIPPSEAEPLLDRLAALAEQPSDVVDLYERQVTRSKAPADRVRALGRAAQIAAQRGELDRARGLIDIALGGTPSDETLATLEGAAREGDADGRLDLRRTLCAAMAAGGQGARDGGRTRGALLRRAASMAHRDLGDIEQAFTWLGDALIAHVDGLTLDALEGLGLELRDPSRAEATLSRALTEVFDGPLVRQLLARRAKIRREQMNDKAGAAADLKKLHDLSPADHAGMDELAALLTELGDYRGMVQLYEDQILRGKDTTARAELARKVARMWEEQLADPREAADGWRRVLRMKPGDAEASAGLERAKSNMLKKPDPTEEDAYSPPKLASSSPAAPAVAPSESVNLGGAVLTVQSSPPPSGTIAAVPPVAPEYEPLLNAADLLAEVDAEERARAAAASERKLAAASGALSETSNAGDAEPVALPALPASAPDELTADQPLRREEDPAPIEEMDTHHDGDLDQSAFGEIATSTVTATDALEARPAPVERDAGEPDPLQEVPASAVHASAELPGVTDVATRDGSAPAILVEDDELIIAGSEDLIEIVDDTRPTQEAQEEAGLAPPSTTHSTTHSNDDNDDPEGADGASGSS